MPENDNNPLSFFQELKRRKVIRVIIMYAAAALALLEAVDIIFPRMGFPDWTITFVIFLLVIGFIITVIFSWIYDITPEGIEKTKSSKEFRKAEKTTTPNSWRVATYVSVVIIAGLIAFNIFGGKKGARIDETLTKSIAVLPFHNLVGQADQAHICLGLTDEIISHLYKVKSFDKVVSLTSILNYQDTDKSITEIADELRVNYILEGTYKRIGENLRVTAQLIEPKNDSHIWQHDYDRPWSEIITIPADIAMEIADHLKAFMSNSEMQHIQKLPTTSLTAYELYQKGQEEFWNYYSDRMNPEALDRSEDLYRYALEFDPAFAKAYTGLAWIYWFRGLRGDSNRDDCLDSVLILANTALGLDDQLADGYALRGNNYRVTGQEDQAIKEFEKALYINPNFWQAYTDIGWYYIWRGDLVKSLENFHKAATFVPGPELPTFFRRNLIYAYDAAGFPEKEEYYNLQALQLDGDSLAYFKTAGWTKYDQGDFENAIAALEKGLAKDSTDVEILGWLGASHMILGQYGKSLEYFQKRYIEQSKAPDFSMQGDINLGYVYWKIGFKKEADYYYGQSFKHLAKKVEKSESDAGTYYSLAAVYLYMGEKEKAYKNLKMYSEKNQYPHKGTVTWLKNAFLLYSIRDEPEFQQIVKDVEAKYQAEHERVRKWLDENNML
jgi:TolB-like protein/Flp pilus assembly protein TadD